MTDKLLEISNLIKRYKDLDTTKRELFRAHFAEKASEIQLADVDGYKYVRDPKLVAIQALLHGAICQDDLVTLDESDPPKKSKAKQKIITSEKYQARKAKREQALVDFVKKDLRLLWGIYVFIDPTENKDERYRKPFYLAGRFEENAVIKPSFTFPYYVSTRNPRGRYESRPVDKKWLEFYLDLNSATRGDKPFTAADVKYFGSESFKRNKDLEGTGHFMYASSGEIDHAILQWLTLTHKSGVVGKRAFNISLEDLDLASYIRQLPKILQAHGYNQSIVSEVISTISDHDESGKLRLTGSKKPGKEGRLWTEWLWRFGFFTEDGLPTERFWAALEFFFYHIDHWKQEKIKKSKFDHEKKFKNRNYFSAISEDGTQTNFYEPPDNGVLPDLVERFWGEAKNGFWLSDDMGEMDYGSNCQSSRLTFSEFVEKDSAEQSKKLRAVSEAYLRALGAYCETDAPNCEFKELVRFNLPSHFVQRCVLPLFDERYKEETCRGFVIVPTFSNPDLDANEGQASQQVESQKKQGTRYLGYFLGLIKDSDDKGRCFFNWRTHSDDRTPGDTGRYFYDEYLPLLQNFVYILGFNEVKQIYYGGIVQMQKQHIRDERMVAQISQIMNRNKAHHLGSHIARGAMNDAVKQRIKSLYSDLTGLY